jgi:hypothetical protein
VFRVEQGLAMQVALIDDVVVAQGQVTHAALHQHPGGWAAQASDADHEHSDVLQGLAHQKYSSRLK